MCLYTPYIGIISWTTGLTLSNEIRMLPSQPAQCCNVQGHNKRKHCINAPLQLSEKFLSSLDSHPHQPVDLTSPLSPCLPGRWKIAPAAGRYVSSAPGPANVANSDAIEQERNIGRGQRKSESVGLSCPRWVSELSSTALMM